jgi:hypothetical protein
MKLINILICAFCLISLSPASAKADLIGRQKEIKKGVLFIYLVDNISGYDADALLSKAKNKIDHVLAKPAADYRFMENGDEKFVLIEAETRYIEAMAARDKLSFGTASLIQALPFSGPVGFRFKGHLFNLSFAQGLKGRVEAGEKLLLALKAVLIQDLKDNALLVWIPEKPGVTRESCEEKFMEILSENKFAVDSYGYFRGTK